MKKITLAAVFIGLFVSVNPLQAGEGHSHGHGHDDISSAHEKNHGHDEGHNKEHSSHESKGEMFLKKQEIDGYSVHFHVMEANDGMRHGGTHNFMIKIEKDGKVLTDVKINSKVVHPNGQSQSKGLMRMGDWYMNGYDLGHDGNHQLMILFKTVDGKKHKGGINYSSK